MVRGRGGLRLPHRLSFLQRLDRDARAPLDATRATPAERLENGRDLHADSSLDRVRPSLRGHRGCGTPDRPDARRPVRLSAGHAVAAGRRGDGRLRAGHARHVLLDAARRTQPRPDGARRTRPSRRHRGAHRHALHHDHPDRGAVARRRQGDGAQPLVHGHRIRDHSDRADRRRVSAHDPAGPRARSDRHRRRAAAAVRRGRRLGGSTPGVA